MTTDQCCRLCMEKSPSANVIDIFDDKSNAVKISEILTQHFCWFEIYPNDEYSKKICRLCWSIVNEFHLLYIKVDAIHRELNEKCYEKSALCEAILDSNAGAAVKCEDDNSEDEHFVEIDSVESKVFSELTLKSSKSIGKQSNLKSRKKDAKPSGEGKTKRLWKTKSERDEDEKKISEFFNLTCEQCSVKFPTFLQLKSHQQSQHNLKRGFIYCCKKKINRHAKLIEHMNWHLNPDSFRCKICQKVYSDNYGLKLHMSCHDPPESKIFECDICSKKFSRKSNLTSHLLVVHIDKKDHKCDCGKTFALHSILQSHIRGVHQNFYRHICDICAKEFKSKDQYQRHRSDHLNSTPKLTCICGAKLKNAVSLQAHIRRTHQENPQTCHECGKVSPNKDALRCHIRYNHTNLQLFQCTLCDKNFKKEIGLKEHMATHLGITLYTCPYCPRTFNSNANRHSHRKKMHPSEWLRDRTRSNN